MQAVLQITDLPAAALDAAAHFHQRWLPSIREHLEREDDLIILMESAPYDHTDWRKAAVRDLARQFAPKRINFVAGDAQHGIEASLEYLAGAKGITGQYLPLHQGAR